ncbi:hypothetical protein KLP40_18790 [Hymenobacter sp. NST-14]|uniref:hypothetical protein n=1 Tax=Hymenobacter piscis TaxID=2839984 RepID=UPI001C028096|nr:hypothetical protein [Hymenobacter piscis]MBT9395223.1 hypothetical protein [Hymenobacter piscis]
MKVIFYITAIVICSICSCTGQRITESTVISPTSTYVKGNNFEGAVFSDSYGVDFFKFDIKQHFRQYQEGASTRFTPTFAQIEFAERILQKSLRHDNRHTFHQSRGYGPIVHRHLPKYQRQYFGYTTASNEQIIYINAGWERYTLIDRLQNLYPRDETWKNDYRIVMDGGSYYWSIEVNLTTGKLSAFGTNGLASLWSNSREDYDV